MKRDPAIHLLAVGQTLTWASIFYAFPALLLRWEQDLGWSKAELTGAITLAILISALASPLSGRLIDRGYGAHLLSGSVALGGAGLLALSQVAELWQFIGLWGLIGFAMAGSMYEPCFAVITRARGAQARRAITVITLVAGFAGTISFPATHYLSEAFGWRGALLCLSGVLVLIVVPLNWIAVRMLEAKIEDRPEMRCKIAQKAFLARPEFWFLALGFACLASVHSATLQHLLPLLDTRGLSTQAAIFAAASIGPMQVVGRLVLLASERHLSTHGVAVCAFAALGLALLMLRFSDAAPVLVAGFVLLFGSAYGTVSIIRPVLAREILGGEDIGAKSGALALPYLGGMALAPFLGALIWRIGGYDLMLNVMICIALLGGFLYAQAQRSRS